LISKTDYHSTNETSYPLSIEANRQELLQSVKNIASKDCRKDALVFETYKGLPDLFDTICKQYNSNQLMVFKEQSKQS
jgi:hypothetical protein